MVSKITKISVDIEADGPYPPKYSMVSIGAVVVDRSLGNTFYSGIRPISDQWVPEALAVSGFTRDDTLAFASASEVMPHFADWVASVSNGGRPLFVADTAGFDFMWVVYYLNEFAGRNPFGHTALSISSLYKGFARNVRADFRRDGLRKRRHAHQALDDAIGNAEAMLLLQDRGMELMLR